jgi:hypothetical protein
MISDSKRKRIEEMRDHLNAALIIAKGLNAPEDAIMQLWKATGAITNPAAYEDVTKISQGQPASLPMPDPEAERQKMLDDIAECQRRGITPPYWIGWASGQQSGNPGHKADRNGGSKGRGKAAVRWLTVVLHCVFVDEWKAKAPCYKVKQKAVQNPAVQPALATLEPVTRLRLYQS